MECYPRGWEADFGSINTRAGAKHSLHLPKLRTLRSMQPSKHTSSGNVACDAEEYFNFMNFLSVKLK
jgi:hypothetical protein